MFVPCLVRFVFTLQNLRLMATLRIVVPFLRDEKFRIDKRMFLPCHVGEERSNLTVVDLAETSKPLPCDACRFFVVLLETARVERENAILLANQLGRLFGQPITHREVVPLDFTDKTLQTPAILTEPIGNRFRVFPIQVGEKTCDERRRVLTGFAPWQASKVRGCVVN